MLRNYVEVLGKAAPPTYHQVLPHTPIDRGLTVSVLLPYREWCLPPII
jgi:hypothetical protein